MEDRFKFRVWFKGAYTYFDFALLNSESTPFYENEIRNSKVEQCTGLKDKKGDLIFEGDVLCFDMVKNSRDIVRWKDGYFYLDATSTEKHGTYPISDVDLINRWEIIGNIHTEAKDGE